MHFLGETASGAAMKPWRRYAAHSGDRESPSPRFSILAPEDFENLRQKKLNAARVHARNACRAPRWSDERLRRSACCDAGRSRCIRSRRRGHPAVRDVVSSAVCSGSSFVKQPDNFWELGSDRSGKENASRSAALRAEFGRYDGNTLCGRSPTASVLVYSPHHVWLTTGYR
jgi:hypothetical protein